MPQNLSIGKIRGLEQLATAGFMETAHNLILVGGTGTGKSHLATAIGVAAIHQGKRVRFFNAVDLVNQLEREKSQGKVGNLAKQLCLMDAVVLDELGYLPFSQAGGALLFHLLSRLYERTSVMITTNLTFNLINDVNVSPRTQMKQALALGATYSLL